MGERVNKQWTKEEIQYLEDNWGYISYETIARKLGRTVEGVRQKKLDLGLGAMLDSGDYITFSRFLEEVGYAYQSKGRTALEKKGLPIHKRRVGKKSFKVVYVDEFWKWAEKNRDFIDFSRLEHLAFGAEPEWVHEQRKIDYEKKHTIRQRYKKWTFVEDERLKRMALSKKYTIIEIAKEFERSECAVKRRLLTLGIQLKGNVLRCKSVKWKPEEIALCNELVLKGRGYDYIASKLNNRSVMSVEQLYYSMCGKTNLDSVREYLKGVSDGADDNI